MNESVRLFTPERLRLRIEDFVLLEENGAFDDYSKAELLDGDVYVMNAQFARHGRAKVQLLVALANRLETIGSDLEVFSEVSVRLANDSMPEPDIFLARRQRYGSVPAEAVALVVEIADTTLSTDLGRKAVLYAAAGIPEYWVVDLNDGRVLMHAHAHADGYHLEVVIAFGVMLEAITIGGLKIDTIRLLD